MSNEIKREDGPKREFSTGAERQTAEGKGTPVLVPGDAILEVAKHFENGVEIYGARNWEKGIPLSEILNSLERHLQQEKMGLTDEPHDRALAWNAMVYLATKIRIEEGLLPKELDDMPRYESTPVVEDFPARLKKGVKRWNDLVKKATAIEEPKLKKGDVVKITPKKMAQETVDIIRENSFIGTIAGPHDVVDWSIILNNVEYGFFTDELTLLEEKKIDPNPSRAVNLTGD